jgi:hypothetical protein
MLDGKLGSAALFLAFSLISTAPAIAADRAAAFPERAYDDGAGGEVVPFADGVAGALLRLPPGETIWLADWPVAPGTFAKVELTRHEIYAPGAKVYAVTAAGPVEVPRSPLAFYWGGAEGSDAALWIAVDPRTGAIHGGSERRGQSFEIHRLAGSTDEYRIGGTEAFVPEDQRPGSFSCGGERLGDLAGSALFAPAPPSFPFAAKKLASVHTATVAVDTDNELMAGKFGDDPGKATAYVAQLFAAMNVMYERDLNVRLVQGTTYLRVSTQADPYPTGTAGNADSTKLSVFANYWSGHYPSVSRALALMLSGQQPAATSASGIAYLNSLCDNASYGYAFAQVFRGPASPASNDSRMVGHEIGHVFGSDHTHCYSTPIDTCYNGEAGRGACYAGPPSCPAPTQIEGVGAVEGTVMSYCHLSPTGCSSSSVFHPRTVDLLNPIVASKVGRCVFPESGAVAVGGARFHTVAPCRAIDTRNPAGPLGGPALGASAKRTFSVAGVCGIPADAKAVSGNLTVATSEADGFVNAYPGGTSPTATSVIHFRAGQIKANNVRLTLPSDGTGILVFDNGAGGKTHFLLDVSGYFK